MDIHKHNKQHLEGISVLLRKEQNKQRQWEKKQLLEHRNNNNNSSSSSPVQKPWHNYFSQIVWFSPYHNKIPRISANSCCFLSAIFTRSSFRNKNNNYNYGELKPNWTKELNKEGCKRESTIRQTKQPIQEQQWYGQKQNQQQWGQHVGKTHIRTVGQRNM